MDAAVPSRDRVEQLIGAYFDAITAQDADGLGAMFGADGELSTVIGTYRGAVEVAGFYRGVFAMGETAPRPGALLVEGNRVAVEIVLELAGSPSRFADFFTVAVGPDGPRIDRLVIYRGGDG